MISYTVDVSDAMAGVSNITPALNQGIAEALELYNDQLLERARTNHRHITQTGALNGSLSSLVSGYTAEAFINDAMAPHGKFIHDGFKSWAPDPFLEEAQDEQDLADKIDQAIQNAISSAGL